KPETPKSYVDVARIANGAIFEGTKGTILADFTSRIIIPNNDDGDLTYYKRRTSDQLLPLVAGTGQPTQAAARPSAAPANKPPLPPGFTAMPSAQPGPSGFPEIQFVNGKIPAALGLPNTSVESIARAGAGASGRRLDPFQVEWLEACKGRSNNAVFGTS